MRYSKGMLDGGATARAKSRLWGRCARAAAALAALMTLVGCGQAATASGGGARTTATARATGTPDTVIHQGPQLSWQSVLVSPEQAQIVVANSDGDTAYSCDVVQPKGDGTTHIWVTHDRGQHWSAGGNIAALAGATSCTLAVDDNNAKVLVATFTTVSGGASPEPFLGAAYASFDGGTTWQELGKGVAIRHVASYQGTYYAWYVDQPTQTSPMQGDLAVSTDQMASWRGVGPDQSISGSWFWVSPVNGSLLETNGQLSTANLSQSDDGGAHWTPVNVPTWTQNILAAPESGAEPWRLCATATPLAANPPNSTNQLACSADGGQTWNTLPALSLTNLSPKGFTYTEPTYVFAVANDGALLATATDSNAITHLYRLPSGTTAWQTLGSLTGIASCSYSSGPGAGVLWQQNINSPVQLTANYPQG